MSRRDRKKPGKLGRDWSPLYEHCLKAEAVRTLPLAAFKVYIVALSLCKPWLNGAVPLLRSQMRQFGIVSSRTMTRALEELLHRKLLVRTREARPRHAALYGLTDRPLNEEAMRKAGIGKTTRTLQESENSDAPGVRESGHQESESGANGQNSDAPGVRIGHFSALNSDSPGVTSKILPGA